MRGSARATHPAAEMAAGLAVVVLTSARIGIEVAESLARLPAVRRITLVTAPAGARRRSLAGKARLIYRLDGFRGVLGAALRRVRHPLSAAETPRLRLRAYAAAVMPQVTHIQVPDLRGPECRAAIAALAPDLGVVVATPILPPSVFGLPALGCVNLHFGKAPEYRGSSPGFREMMAGEREVGVTVHRVTEMLDGGEILAQECFALDSAPAGDPIAYLARYQRTVLVSEGIRMMGDVAAALAAGPVVGRPQNHTGAPAGRRATYAEKRELRRVVARRRTLPPG